MSFPIEAIKIDFTEEPSFGHDQANVTYPTVFPTVTFWLEPNHQLIDQLTWIDGFDPDGLFEFTIGINGFTKTKLDNCILADYEGKSYAIDLDEETQRQVYDVLDQQCKEHLGKGCDALLDEAKALIE